MYEQTFENMYQSINQIDKKSAYKWQENCDGDFKIEATGSCLQHLLKLFILVVFHFFMLILSYG